MRRRTFIKAGAALSLAGTLPLAKAQEVPTHNWENYDFGPGPQDIMLLQKCASVATMAHAPFFAAAGPQLDPA